MMMRLFLLALVLLPVSCSRTSRDERPEKPGNGGFPTIYYTNPVIRNNCADPDVFDDRERTGYFYAYSTQNSNYYIPVYRSTDLVNWTFVCDAFGGDKPDWLGDGSRTWAPNVRYIGGRYVMYFAQGLIGDSSFSGTGVAWSDSPAGPFLWRDLDDNGRLITTGMTGMHNMIDPVYAEDRQTGTSYLFVGGFGEQGLWAIELKPGGLGFAKDCTVETNRTKFARGMEGTYVHYHEGYYYVFGSVGSCCSGRESTYHLIVARSRNLLGPYVLKDGTLLTEYTTWTPDANTILRNPDAEPGMYPYFAGVGHNASIITDDDGQDWMCYHAYWRDNNYNGRCMCLDPIIWQNGWPTFRTGHPSQTRTAGPKFRAKAGKAVILLPTREESDRCGIVWGRGAGWTGPFRRAKNR